MYQLTDVEQIFAVLAGLYVLELAVWLPPDSYLIRSVLGKFTLQTKTPLLANEKGSLHWSGPAPWDASFIIAFPELSLAASSIVNYRIARPGKSGTPETTRHAPPISLSLTEILAFSSSPKGIQATTHKGQVLDVFVSNDERLNKSLCEKLSEISQQTDVQEQQLLIDKFYGELLSFTKANERISQWRDQTKVISILSTHLFNWVFPLGLTLYYIDPQVLPKSVLVWPYFVGLLALWWSIVVRSYLAHRYLFPTERVSRYVSTFIHLVSPVACMRASDHLARRLFAFGHPLPIASALLTINRYELQKAARRDAEYPAEIFDSQELDSITISILSQAHACYRRALQEEMERNPDVYLPIVTSKPGDADEYESETLSSCQRCLREFTLPDAACEFCNGRISQALNQ
jgi:hypothetical protein